MGRRQFAKNSKDVRHFKLVTRSQNDANPEAAPLVLEPFVPHNEQRRTGLTEAELLEIPESLQKLGPETFGLGEHAEEEDASPSALGGRGRGAKDGSDDDEEEYEDPEALLDEDCYFPRDGYNYEQHLKRVSGTGKAGGVVGVVLAAPQQVDVKQIELQSARTQEEAEALRALEEADEYEELEEEGIDELFAGGVREDADEVLWGPTAAEHRDMPDLAAFKLAHQRAMGFAPDGADDNEDGVAAARHADGEDINEEDFDQFLADEYNDDEIGACEEEEIEGHLEDCDDAVEEYLQAKELEDKTLQSLNEPVKGKYDNVPRATEETKAIIARHYNEIPEDDDEETQSGDETQDESRNWDCESVLSTLSNLSNRPGKIGKIKVIAKPKAKEMPKLAEVREEDEKEGDGSEGDDNESVLELPDVITERKKGETAEERRARKASVKEMRRVCRQMKKETKQVYKEEASKMPGSQATADVKQKVRYQKL